MYQYYSRSSPPEQGSTTCRIISLFAIELFDLERVSFATSPASRTPDKPRSRSPLSHTRTDNVRTERIAGCGGNNPPSREGTRASESTSAARGIECRFDPESRAVEAVSGQPG